MDVLICPHCGGSLEADDYYDHGCEGDYFWQHAYGHCVECEKEYAWTECFEFSNIQALREVE